MAYEFNGITRSLKVSVNKIVDGFQAQGYPRTYDGRQAGNTWGNPSFAALTYDELSQLSDADFTTRYNAFKSYVEFVEGCNFATDVVGDGATKSGPWCFLTTTTTISPITTTTTTAIPEYPTNYNRIAYYVSNTGSDNNSGISKMAPLLTISKVNKLVLAPGDAVLFDSQSSWNETLTIPSSGTSSNPITFGAYGPTNSKPKIYGSEIITGWTPHTGSIWKATVAANITQLFVNGVRQKLARLTNTGYSNIASVASQTVFTANVSGAIDYAGASVMLRPENYFSEMRTVQSSVGSTITLASAVSGGATIAVNEGALFMNKLEFLNSAGEWYYDTVAKIVYLWTPNGDSPANYEVRGSNTNTGVIGTAKNFVTIQDLEILQQKSIGISVSNNSNDITIQNCTIDGQESYGIYSLSGTHWLVNRNTITNQNGYGIYANITASTISNNSVLNIGLFDSLGLLGTTVNNGGNAMEISGVVNNGNTIEYNRIENINYNGIFFRGTSTVKNNFIKNCCLSKADGGAIYTGSSGAPTTQGSVVEYNIVDGVVGSVQGFTFDRPYGFGIYIDEGSVINTVRFNSITNCSDAGIFLHRPNSHTVNNNTSFGNRYGLMYSNVPTGTSNFYDNIVITNSSTNDYEPRQLAVYAKTTGVILNNNKYVNGFPNDAVFRIIDGTYKDFAGWRLATDESPTSAYIGNDLISGETQKMFYNITRSPKVFFVNGATNVRNVVTQAVVSGSFILEPFESVVLKGVNLQQIT